MNAHGTERGRGIDRLILWLSLAGMILAIHLWIQKARGFDQGCLGVETHAVATTEGGCTDHTLQAGSHLLGVSNAAWGYAFYFGLALLSFGKIVVSGCWSRRLHVVGEILATLAFGYSAYLLYFQAFVAQAFCVLCLTSIGLVAALFVLHVALRLRGGFKPLAQDARATELGLAAGALFAGMGVLVGVLVFVNRLGTRPLDDGSGAVEMRRIVGEMLPAYIDQDRLDEMQACHFDGLAPKVDLTRFIGPDTPFVGKLDGVPVVVFLDPHCPHCRKFYLEYAELMSKYRDRAKFYVVPRVLWDFSIPAVAALKLAEPSGKYFDLWKREFEEPPGSRLTVARLGELYAELGLDATDMSKRIESVRSQVVIGRERAIKAGIARVPSLFIGGKVVFSTNYSVECLGRLIDTANALSKIGTRDSVQK